jgi:hypothetical protein
MIIRQIAVNSFMIGPFQVVATPSINGPDCLIVRLLPHR